MNQPAPPRLQTLTEVDAAVWRELGRAALDRHHEWRTPVLASGHASGVDARTVVLRETDRDARCLAFYSDARAAKVQQLLLDGQCMLVMWSARLGWQLRLRARAVVHTDGLAVSSRWTRLRLSPAARDYLAPQAPGTALDADQEPPHAVAFAPVQPAAPATERGHFALLQAHVEQIDWLELHRDGHRRALFDSTGARWLVP